MRCDNEHFVPAGFAYCRRCEDGSVAPRVAVATGTLLTVGQYVERRDRMVVVDSAVVVACLIVLAGRSPVAILPAAAVVIAALLVARLVVRNLRPAPDPTPATALHVRRLDRLVLAPGVVVAVTAVAALLRW